VKNISILDILGTTIATNFDYTISNEIIHFTLPEEITKGVYMLKMETNEGVKVQTIVVK